MRNMDNRKALKLSFPLCFGFIYTVFYSIMVGSTPVFAMQLPSFFWFFALVSIVALPFMESGFAYPPIWIAGAVVVALLSGAVQYIYGKNLIGDWRWQLCLVALVTWVQTGLFLGVSFLLVLWSNHWGLSG